MYHVLHEGQMELRRSKSGIDVMAKVINHLQNVLVEGRLECILLINVKEVFDHVSRNCLLRPVESMGRDRDLM